MENQNLTQEEKEKLVCKLYQEGKSQSECAKTAHTSLRKVKEYLLKNNISIRNKKEAAQLAVAQGRCKKITYTEEQKEIVLRTYVKEKRGQVYCCKQANCSEAVLKKILEDNNIHIRTYAEAAVVSNINRAKHKNIEYFNHQSHNMAWLLGFLAADGSISKTDNKIQIKLSAKDKEILEKIKNEIEIENDISGYTSADGFDVVGLTWSCAEHKQALADYSIIPEKTFVLKPPTKLEPQYQIDYVRGYFDGDGSVNLIHNKDYTSIRWQVCSATPEILEFILDVLNNYGISKVNIQKAQRSNAPIYFIQYSSRAARRIYDVLYSTDSNMFLKRKKEHFTEIIKECKAGLDYLDYYK